MVKTAFLSGLVLLIALGGCASPGINPDQKAPPVKKKSFKKLENDDASDATRGQARSINTLVKRAQQYERQDELEKAIAVIERALGIQSKDAYLWYYLGKLHFAKGQFRKSIRFARRSNQFAGADSEQRILNDELISLSRESL